jgi:anti-anti-sigma factor
MRDIVTLDPAGSGRWKLSGALTFDTVPDAWELLRPLLGQPGEVTLSLGGIKRANSAALGLLLEGVELAQRSDCRLVLRDLPQTLRDLAAMSNLESVLPQDA